MTDQQWELLAKVALIALTAAFWPQIRRFLHRLGYRDWREKKDDTKPRS